MNYSDIKRHLNYHGFTPSHIQQTGPATFALTYTATNPSHPLPTNLAEVEDDYRISLPGVTAIATQFPDPDHLLVTITLNEDTVRKHAGEAINNDFERLFGIRLPSSLESEMGLTPAPYEQGAPVKLLQSIGPLPTGAHGIITYSPQDGAKYTVTFPLDGNHSIELTLNHHQLAELAWHELS